MKFSVIVLSATLLAGFAWALPANTSALIDAEIGEISIIPSQGVAEVASSSASTPDLAGNFIPNAPKGDNITSLTSVVRCPSVSPPTSKDGTWIGAVVLGILGGRTSTAAIQAGIFWNVTRAHSKVTHEYLLYTAVGGGQLLAGIPVKVVPGDHIEIELVVDSHSKGTAHFTNQRTKGKFSRALPLPASDSPIWGTEVEWAVAGLRSNNVVLPYAKYGTVPFTASAARTRKHAVLHPGDANAINLKMVNGQGKVIAAGTTPQKTEVLVTHK